METNRTKKLVVVFDILSLCCGAIGICLGMLSIFALQHWWPVHSTDPEHTRGINSLVITCVCLLFDSCSAAFALMSFAFGKQIYKTINFNDIDPVGLRLSKHEKKSYEFDKFSFIISIIGLCFGIASLLTIVPKSFKWISIGLTITAVVLDFVSAILIVCALNQYKKYENVKSIVKLAQESMNLSQTRR